MLVFIRWQLFAWITKLLTNLILVLQNWCRTSRLQMKNHCVAFISQTYTISLSQSSPESANKKSTSKLRSLQSQRTSRELDELQISIGIKFLPVFGAPFNYFSLSNPPGGRPLWSAPLNTKIKHRIIECDSTFGIRDKDGSCPRWLRQLSFQHVFQTDQWIFDSLIHIHSAINLPCSWSFERIFQRCPSADTDR